VITAADASVDFAVASMRAGATDFLPRSASPGVLLGLLRRAAAEAPPGNGREAMYSQVSARDFIAGEHAGLEAIRSFAERVAGVPEATVLITGESGTGKSCLARAIHALAGLEKRFVEVGCATLPPTLIESELFGHERGAFTGAEVQKPGKFELAQGGTLFLDEISNMPLGSQAKLLRVIQEKKVYRVGGTKPISVNVRLLVASNQDLHELTESDSFRRDLFYRLNEFSIGVPPLRERKEDIPYLAKRFLDLANIELKKNVRGFSESALNMMFNYPWPGNVRQLRSTIRRAALLADELITEKHLDLKRVPVPGLAFTPKVEGTPWKGLSLREIVEQSTTAVEREVLTQVLKNTGGNKAKAARLLKMDYKTIHVKLKKLGISEKGIEVGQEDHQPFQENSAERLSA